MRPFLRPAGRTLAVALVLIACPAAFAQQSQSAKPQQSMSAPTPQGFSVVLVLGDMQGGSTTDAVPAAARKALADLKDFLPYKSYRLLDTQWTSSGGHSPLMSRLRGPDDQDYDLELNPNPAGNGKWAIRFVLREPAVGMYSAEYSGALREKEIVVLTAQRNELETRLVLARQKYSENHPDVIQLRTQIGDVARRIDVVRLEDATRNVSAAAGAARDARRAVIDTSFTMDIGETVVVGTSRLKGDKALIALLTAIPQLR